MVLKLANWIVNDTKQISMQFAYFSVSRQVWVPYIFLLYQTVFVHYSHGKYMHELSLFLEKSTFLDLKVYRNSWTHLL